MMQLLRFRAAAAVAFAMTVPNFAAAQTAPAIQVPIPKTAADVPGPVPGNTMTSAYVQLVGRMAYVWGYPMVNAHNRRAAFAEAPEPGLLGGVVPIAPVGFNQMLTDYLKPDQTFIVCPKPAEPEPIGLVYHPWRACHPPGGCHEPVTDGAL